MKNRIPPRCVQSKNNFINEKYVPKALENAHVVFTQTFISFARSNDFGYEIAPVVRPFVFDNLQRKSKSNKAYKDRKYHKNKRKYRKKMCLMHK